MDYRTLLEAITAEVVTEGVGPVGFGGTDVGDVHRIAQQPHQLEIQRCDDGVDRRLLQVHNRPKQTARTPSVKIRGRAKLSKQARNAANRQMIGRT